ncbi:hypothetical protein Bca4012_091468 [Brassica carinata]
MKNTKGKQKIEMKEVEDYENRMTTFSKRKTGIFKKMSELVALCGVEAAFVAFSETGKSHTFAHPSMEDAVGRLKSPLIDESPRKDDTNTDSLVGAYKRQKNEELKKLYADFAEELEMEEEKEKKLKKSKSDKRFDKKWWNAEDESFSVEELKRRHQAFIELHNSLCGKALQRSGKDGDDSSSCPAGHGHFGGSQAEACEQT